MFEAPEAEHGVRAAAMAATTVAAIMQCVREQELGVILARLDRVDLSVSMARIDSARRKMEGVRFVFPFLSSGWLRVRLIT